MKIKVVISPKGGKQKAKVISCPSALPQLMNQMEKLLNTSEFVLKTSKDLPLTGLDQLKKDDSVFIEFTGDGEASYLTKGKGVRSTSSASIKTVESPGDESEDEEKDTSTRNRKTSSFLRRTLMRSMRGGTSEDVASRSDSDLSRFCKTDPGGDSADLKKMYTEALSDKSVKRRNSAAVTDPDIDNRRSKEQPASPLLGEKMFNGMPEKDLFAMSIRRQEMVGNLPLLFSLLYHRLLMLLEKKKKKPRPLEVLSELPFSSMNVMCDLQSELTDAQSSAWHGIIWKVEDIGCLGSMLVQYFESQPDPLLTYDCYERFIQASTITEPSFLLCTLSSLVMGLPNVNRQVLKKLIFLLQRLSSFSPPEHTSVDLESMARIFAPLLLKNVKKKSDTSDPTISKADANDPREKVVLLLIENYQPLFVGMQDVVFCEEAGGDTMIISAATFPRLLERIGDASYRDRTFFKIMVTTWRYFTQPAQMLQPLIECYMANYSKEEVMKWKVERRVRLLHFIREWLQDPNVNEDQKARVELLPIVKDFLNSLPEVSEKEHNFISFLRRWSEEESDVTPQSKRVNLYNIKINNSADSAAEVDILTISQKVIAEQLCIYEHNLFKMIPVHEYMFKSYETPERAPHFTEMATQFNVFNRWVPHEILKRDNPTQRAETIGKFVSIAQELLTIRNFHSAFWVVLGLGHAAITRLKHTWEKVPKKVKAHYDALQSQLSFEQNYVKYRQLLSEVVYPAIPYLALFSKDLFAIEENIPTYIKPSACVDPVDGITCSSPASLCSSTADAEDQKAEGVSAKAVSTQLALSIAMHKRKGRSPGGSPHDSDGEDESPSQKPAEPLKLVNFDKMRVLWRVITQAKMFKTCNYEFEANEQLLCMLAQLKDTVMDEKQIYDMSLTREPRGS
mmetsp:Transcript_52372/g.131582  ORF Transcript_52372/g.131582 Transcript_52372/m.131582 type:complete len:904 (-) Transcript_52372:231-2942(-)|eukprot:CAMPEP_0177652962 /NCGR_PEP_ID=MMETSP0447-20121125/13451_1 /TAXON_ID=0 /ORGANISM="Stygamoeba regulata, Strain BSH-02190019" /LENGTH=903 /DNA_ID=CAMNT_0019156325 /DNA_START=58 /DNA_END=2769 /DNA_ORIENTATION=-